MVTCLDWATQGKALPAGEDQWMGRMRGEEASSGCTRLGTRWAVSPLVAIVLCLRRRQLPTTDCQAEDMPGARGTQS